jgi:hypothetical protein
MRQMIVVNYLTRPPSSPQKSFIFPPPFLFIFVYLFKKEKSPAIRRTCIKYQKTDRQVNRREISRKRFITHVGIMVL